MTTSAVRDAEAMALGQLTFGAIWRPTLIARANGRIEIIGNHVDYNGGPVLAAAIDRGITVLAAETSSGAIRAAFPDVSDDISPPLSVESLGGWRTTSSDGPLDYLKGVVAAALATGLAVRGSLDLLVHGDLPVGGALSSSAALCVSLANILVERPPEKPELVFLAQDAEHRVGAPVGTMDQSASVFGGIILFGGSPDRVTPMSVDLAEHRFVVLGSGVQHRVADSSYGKRVEECRRALELLRAHLDRTPGVLADVTREELEAAESAAVFSAEPTLYLRARHIVTEVARVRRALAAIESSDWAAFGELMSASGHSSATDYDISHPEVEDLVGLAREVPGVLGARMMGGGEGGNALALVELTAVDRLIETLTDRFYGSRGLDADQLTFVCRLGEGASVSAVDRQ